MAVGKKNPSSDDEKTAQELELAYIRKIEQTENKAMLTQYQLDLLRWSNNIDRGYAWVVLFTAWVMLNFTLLSCRIYGLIYARVIELEVYNREQASWPSSAMYAVENGSGPLISIIAFYLPTRTTMFMGQTLLGTGNVLAYFSRNLYLDLLFAGVMQGFGLAFIFVPFLSVINSYFVKHRNMALGLALSGGTFSVYIFSPLFVYILETNPDDFRLSYLTLGILILGSTVLIPVLKSNVRPRNPNANRLITSKHFGHDNGEMSGQVSANKQHRNLAFENSLTALKSRSSFRSASTIQYARRRHGSSVRNTMVSVNPFAKSNSFRELSRQAEHLSQVGHQLNSVTSNNSINAAPVDVSCNKQSSPVPNNNSFISNNAAIAKLSQFESNNNQDNDNLTINSNRSKILAAAALIAAKEHQENKQICNDTESIAVEFEDIGKENKFEFKIIGEIFMNFTFHLIWFIELTYFWIFSVFTVVIIDLAVDRGIEREDATFLIGYWSLGELIGRLILTALVDMSKIPNRAVVIVLEFGTAACLIAVLYTRSYFQLAALEAAISAFISLLYIMINGLLVDSVGEEQVTISFGLASCITGVLLTARTPVIGYCRDVLKTYDWLIGVLIAITLLGGFLWIIETIIHNRKERKLAESQKEVKLEQKL